MNPDEIAELIRHALPDALVEVVDTTGTQDHFAVRVASDAFKGVSLLDQHRLIHRALAIPRAGGRIHALEIETATLT